MRQSKYLSGYGKQSGVTIIELLVYIIIGVIILAAAVAGVSKAFSNNGTSQEVANYQDLLTSAKSLRGSNGYGTNNASLIPMLKARDALPNNIAIDSSNNLTNSYSGAITFVSTGYGTKLTSAGIPASACIEIATKVSQGAATTTSINGGTAIAGQFDNATATTQCSSDTNSVAFTTSS